MRGIRSEKVSLLKLNALVFYENMTIIVVLVKKGFDGEIVKKLITNHFSEKQGTCIIYFFLLANEVRGLFTKKHMSELKNVSFGLGHVTFTSQKYKNWIL